MSAPIVADRSERCWRQQQAESTQIEHLAPDRFACSVRIGSTAVERKARDDGPQYGKGHIAIYAAQFADGEDAEGRSDRGDRDDNERAPLKRKDIVFAAMCVVPGRGRERGCAPAECGCEGAERQFRHNKVLWGFRFFVLLGSESVRICLEHEPSKETENEHKRDKDAHGRVIQSGENVDKCVGVD